LRTDVDRRKVRIPASREGEKAAHSHREGASGPPRRTDGKQLSDDKDYRDEDM